MLKKEHKLAIAGAEVTKVEMPKLKEAEIKQLIEEQFLCRIAFKGDLQLYIAPFSTLITKAFFTFISQITGRR